MKNKRGLSAIVMTVILVGLVLVAVGIVWAVVLNILEGQEEKLDVSQKCLGIIIKPTSISCAGGECNVVLERAMGSAGDAVDGVEITVGDGLDTATETEDGNVAATKTVSVTTDMLATEADVRIYFDDAEYYEGNFREFDKTKTVFLVGITSMTIMVAIYKKKK